MQGPKLNCEQKEHSTNILAKNHFFRAKSMMRLLRNGMGYRESDGSTTQSKVVLISRYPKVRRAVVCGHIC